MHDDTAILKRIPNLLLFRDIDPALAAELIGLGRWRRCEQGQYISSVAEWEPSFYLVADGEVELSMEVEDGGRHIVSRIGPGGHFGETYLLTGHSSNLTARAVTVAELLCYDLETFNTVLLANQTIQYQLNVALANRLLLSFRDHAHSLGKTTSSRKDASHNLDSTFFSDPKSLINTSEPSQDFSRELRFAESTIARQINKAVQQFSNNLEPVLLSGESGTGRRMIASEIHRGSPNRKGPYAEIDVRGIDPVQLDLELFGSDQDAPAFSQTAQLGIFERLRGGTVVLYNGEHMEPDSQRQLARLLKKASAARSGGDHSPQQPRVILICKDAPGQQDGHNRLLPSLHALFAHQHFRAAPLREHRRDIPRLVKYYLKRYCQQYGKTITQVDEQTLGRFMNYDWPGNLNEMSSVLQRAVLLGKSHEPLDHQIILGVPKSEGKWEFNLLRLPKIRAFFASNLFPELARLTVGVFFVLVLLTLFLGPADAESNIGLTLSWVVGWPLLIFSFFFLARTWCSICGLSVPGWLAQLVLKPERATPLFIKRYSGWIMTLLCILLFWIEVSWNAYQSPRLTAWIILAITMGSLVFSMFYKRRVWCRFLCPLGAINALFSMPAILELRSNTHMCMNRCIDHLCYNGDDGAAGCPMFRHPFLVDNNRDCILCGQCIKNCKLHSIHLNLRLAPQELWNQQSPRLEDSFLVLSLAAIFLPFALNIKDPQFIHEWTAALHSSALPESVGLATAILFLLCISLYLGGYTIMSHIIAVLTGNNWKNTASMLGYGMIPLVLGAFMAAHLEILVSGIWLLPKNLLAFFSVEPAFGTYRAMSRDTTFVLQFITVAGGLIASLYATHRITRRLVAGRRYLLKMFMPSALLLCLSALAYLYLL